MDPRRLSRLLTLGGILAAVSLLLVLCGRPRASQAQERLASDPATGRQPLTASEIQFTLRYAAQEERPANGDRWWARDKARHVAFSALWTLSTQYVLVSKAGWSETDALPASVASAASVGLAKEMYDARSHSGGFSTKDLAADAVGICLAAGVIIL